MKRSGALLVLMLAAVFAVGCGKSEKTVYKSPEGKVTVKSEKSAKGEEQTVKIQTDEGAVTVEGKVEKSKGGEVEKVTAKTKEGTVTVMSGGGRPVTEAEVGVPVYPGAKAAGSGKYTSKNPSGEPSLTHHILFTEDSFEKVVAFYKSRLKNVQHQQDISSGDQKVTMFQIGSGQNQTMIQIVRDPKEKRTMIHVMKQAI